MFRPNLQNEDHRRAWALLQAVPEGQKSAFLVKAILDSARQDALESVSYTHLDVYKRQSAF